MSIVPAVLLHVYTRQRDAPFPVLACSARTPLPTGSKEASRFGPFGSVHDNIEGVKRTSFLSPSGRDHLTRLINSRQHRRTDNSFDRALLAMTTAARSL
jgi:hypothetical protein